MVNGRKKGGFGRYNVKSMNSGKIVKLSLQHIKLTHLLIRVIFIILNNKLCIYYVDRDFNFFFIIGGSPGFYGTAVLNV